jgi:AbrB family looped-hinge helix DNA binding protein
MKTATARLSSRGQMVIPKEIRQALGLEAGDTVFFVLEGDSVRMFPQPKDYAQYTRGLGKEMWAKLGGGEKFLREERESWE